MTDLYLVDKSESESLKGSIEEITRMFFGFIKNINQKVPLRLETRTRTKIVSSAIF